MKFGQRELRADGKMKSNLGKVGTGSAAKKSNLQIERRNSSMSVWDPRVEVETNHYNWTDDPVHTPPNRQLENDQSSYFMVDLFSGCGGFSVGFESAGFKSILAIDIHPPSLETFAKNHPGSATILGDIRKIPTEMVLKALDGKHVSIVTAGVPCQGFSLCNRKRFDEDKRNFLFKEFLRIAGAIKPDVVLLENVSGIRTAGNGSFTREIEKGIATLGNKTSVQMLNAADFGVPQKRTRVFFMGVNQGIEIRWPTRTHGIGKTPYVTVWEAIGDLPSIESGESATKYVSGPKTTYQEKMRSGADLLLNHEAPSHPQETIDKIRNTKPGHPMYPKFKQRIRLHPDDLSPTQVSGGIRPQFQFGHPTQARGLTVRERCRIQSFPDVFYVSGGTVQGRVQTGNAVPPLLAESIATTILRSLRGETFEVEEHSYPAEQMALPVR